MRLSVVSLLGVLCLVCADPVEAQRIALSEGWTLQSSATVKAPGATLSAPGVDVSGWHRISVPNTVVGALVEIGHFPDPYF